MLVLLRRLCLAAGLVALASPALAGAPAYEPLVDSLARTAPKLDRQVLTHAVAAMQCAVNNGATPADRLAVIDFSRPSSERRLWIFDLRQQRLLLRDFVAHGQKSGENLATRFSNRVGSHQSSIGLFRTAESYTGKHGYSLRMDGLEPGINDRARERAIVMHGAAYVDPLQALRQGRLGRSFGCPAVRTAVARPLIDAIKQGQLLYADAGAAAATSALAECRRDSAASAGAQRQAAATRP